MYTITPKHITATVQSFDDIKALAKLDEVRVNYHLIVVAVDRQQLFRVESKFDKGIERKGGAGNKLDYIAYGKYRENAETNGYGVHIDQDRFDLLKSLFAKGVLVTIRIFIA